MILEILIGAVLLIFALIDLKFKAIPSFMTTIVILGLILINEKNILFGIAGAVFGLFLYEFNFLKARFFGGIADIKVLSIIGLMISNLQDFSIMMVILMGLSVLTAILRFYLYKEKANREFAFIPVLFLTYLIMETIKWA